MYIIEIFLPLRSNSGASFPNHVFTEQKSLLLERFGGLTVYARSPAEGLWNKGESTVVDSMVVFEVLSDKLDQAWWRLYRQTLEDLFK